MRFTQVILFVFLSLLFLGQRAVAEDENEQCGEWAAMGECDANPGYMLSHCADACAEVAASAGASPPLPESFYDIAEQDLDGNDLLMSEFRGKVVYIVNVASHCGYTKENYDMFRKLAKYRSKGLEMVLAPCNQFGQQEPGDAVSISNFAKKHEFEGTILAKDNVNGPKTRTLFRYLKNASGVGNIGWNFDGKFLVSKSGSVFHVQDIKDLEQMIKELL